jgi:hypothetical protein
MLFIGALYIFYRHVPAIAPHVEPNGLTIIDKYCIVPAKPVTARFVVGFFLDSL